MPVHQRAEYVKRHDLHVHGHYVPRHPGPATLAQPGGGNATISPGGSGIVTESPA
jgi:hypothetical protein